AYPAEEGAAREVLGRQLVSPVAFVEEIENLHGSGVHTFLEIGPGRTLTGLVSAILAGREHAALALDASGGRRSGLADLAAVLARLAALGHGVELRAWDRGFAPPAVERDPGKKKFTVSICGANYVRPKPAQPAQDRERTAPAPPPVAASAAPSAVPPPGSRASAPRVEPAATPVAQPLAPPPPAPSSSSPPGNLDAALLATREYLLALTQAQERTAALHRQFLEGQAVSQRILERLIEQQAALFGASAIPAARATPSVLEPSTGAAAASPPAGAAAIEAPAPVVRAPAESAAMPEPAAPARETESPRTAGGADRARIAAVLLEVVADKTGYPTDMLSLEMGLDADLGIDSIKRVEILSALEERLPDLPAGRSEQFGELRTLAEIVDLLAGPAGAPPPPPSAEPAAAECAASEPTAGEPVEPPPRETESPRPSGGADRTRIATVLLEVVADKTGYPTDMLSLEMGLDADLGIDSIKRVEILSALEERLPALPGLRSEQLGELRTLAQIVDLLAGQPGAPVETVAAEPTGSAAAAVEPAAPPRLEPEPPPEKAAPLPAGAEPPARLLRSVLEAVALDLTRRRDGVELPRGAEIWVTFDATRLAPILAERLGGLGYRVTPVALSDVEALVVPERLGGLVILAPERGADAALLRAAFRLVQRTGPALRRVGREKGALLATVSRLDGAFGTTASGPATDPRAGALAGLVKTAAREWPEVCARALDVDPALSPDAAAAALSDELFHTSPVEVGIGAAHRIVLELIAAPTAAPGPCPLAAGDVVLVSGGGRGITAEAAVALAQASRATLVLLGRTLPPEPDPEWLRPLVEEAEIKRALRAQGDEPLTPRQLEARYQRVMASREIRRTIARIEAAGAAAIYRSVDVCDAAAVGACVAEVRREHGPICGLVHGAGVLADRRILDKTLEQLDRVWATKVRGLEVLLEALEPDRGGLKLLVLFSSSTGRFGRTGQADYAMANEALNKIAQREAHRRPGGRVVALNWGPWDGGMVTPSLRGLFVAEGIELISVEAGAAAFLEEIALGAGAPAEVVLMAPAAAAAPAAATAAPILATPVDAMQTAFDRPVDLESYPVLAAHVLDHRPVVPMALLVEWLAHGAMHGNPGLRFQGFDELRVLKGMVLEDELPHRVRVLAGRATARAGDYVVPVELHSDLRSGRDTLHAAAEIRLAAELEPAAAPALAVDPGAFPHGVEAIYAERLFHGAELQGIQTVERCSAAGIVVVSRTAPPPDRWIRSPLRHRWLADPLVLDSSFQAVILWCLEHRGEAALPSRAGRYRQFARAFPGEAIRIVARIRRASAHAVNADLEYLSSEGRMVARLEDLECTLGASLKAAFRRNRLAHEAHPARPA
ncbi:MAG: SDR family NAD(P)-dependent oxidoreductase, partial [Planctomycetes bacterium]|nr:SDR family NAD(P)-dependent oxidoreductase [Planctomycetota bacterium]